MTEKKKEKQPNLYGDADQVFSVLETERTDKVKEIESAHKKIANLKEKIDALTERKDALDEAIETVGQQRDVLKKGEKPE